MGNNFDAEALMKDLFGAAKVDSWTCPHHPTNPITWVKGHPMCSDDDCIYGRDRKGLG